MKDLNRELLLSNLMNDDGLAEEILGIYVESAPELLEKAGSSLAEGNMDSARLNLHSLAGASANVGAERLAAAAAVGEKSAVAADLPKLEQQIQELKQLYRDFIRALEEC